MSRVVSNGFSKPHMNTYLKLASAAMLSVVAVSVAALSVPSVKIHALKLMGEFNGDQVAVANVTVKNKSIPAAPVIETIETGFNAPALLKVISPADNEGGGVSGGSGTSAGAGGEEASSNEYAVRGGSGVIPGGSSRGGGQGAGGSGGAGAPGAGGQGSNPAEPGVPGEEAVASNGGGSTPGGGRNPEEGAAPGGPGADATEPLISVDEVVADIAALPTAPGDGLGSRDPVTTNELLPIAPLAESPSAIPEPGTLALVAVAMLGLGALRRRRAQR